MAPTTTTPRPLRDSTERPWGFFGLIGAVALAAVALLVGPSLLAPQPIPGPSAAQPTGLTLAEQHMIAAPQGTFTIAYDQGAVVISRIDGTIATELGRAPVSVDFQPAASGDPLGGSSEWTMACPTTTGGEPLRFIFGSIFPPDDAQYVGPPAAGTFASDGLYLYILAPGHIDPGAIIRIETRGGSVGVDGSTFDLTLNSGASQASGCRLE